MEGQENHWGQGQSEKVSPRQVGIAETVTISENIWRTSCLEFPWKEFFWFCVCMREEE